VTRRIVLVWNASSGAALFLVSVITAFLVSPIVVRALGNRDYGVWDVVLSFVAYSRLLELGVGPALVRTMAQDIARRSREALQETLSTGLLSLSLVGVAVLVLFALVARSPEILVGESLSRDHGTVVLLAGATLFVQFVGTTFTCLLLAQQYHYLVNLIRVLLTPIQGWLWVQFLRDGDGHGLMAVAAVLLGTTVVEYLAIALLALTRGHAVPPRIDRVTGSRLRHLYSFGVKSSLTMLAMRLRRESIPIAIAHIIGVQYVVFFALPSRLVGYGQSFLEAIRQPIMPYFSVLDVGDDDAAGREAWFGLARAMQFLLLWIPTAIFFLGAPFLGRWVGPEYADEGLWVIRILSIGMLLDFTAPMAGSVLVAKNRHGRAAIWSTGWSVVTVLLAVTLTASYGIVGSAIAVAATSGAISITNLILVGSALGFGVREHFGRTLLGFAIPLVASGASLTVLARWAEPVGYLQIIAHGSLSLIVYVGISWRTSLDDAERRFFRSRLRFPRRGGGRTRERTTPSRRGQGGSVPPFPYTDSPSVSVIIPVYNAQATLERAVRSAIAAGRDFDLEVLVIDDRSEDRSREIAGHLERELDPVRVLSNHRSKGAAGARNEGLEAARGEYIAFLDADDVWLPSHLATLVRLLRENPSMDLALANAEVRNGPDDTPLGEWFAERRWTPRPGENAGLRDLVEDPIELLLRDSFVHLQNLVVRRCVGQELRFNERLRVSDDRDFAIHALDNRHEMLVVNVITSIYYRWPGSLTSTTVEATLGTLESRRVLYTEYMQSLPGHRALVRCQLRAVHAEIAYLKRLAGNPRDAISHALDGLRFGVSVPLLKQALLACVAIPPRGDRS